MKPKDILDLPGVVGAVQFTPKGDLESYRGSLSETEARTAAQMCSSNTTLMQMQARLFADYSRQPEWKSYQGWAMLGPKRGILVVGDTLCMLDTAQASINELVDALTGR